MRRLKTIIMAFSIILWPTLGLMAGISVTPYEGGTNLSFGRIDASSLINREVRIRMTPAAARQYQVFQRVSRDFLSTRGRRLDLGAITASALRGSNSSGTLYLDQPAILSYRDELIYTSGPNGTADSFIIVYTVRGNRLSASGEFWGQIIYTLRPIGGGPEEQVYLDVYLDAAGGLSIKTEASSGKDRIRLGTEEGRDRQGYVKFDFKGNLGTLKIYQEMTNLPQNDLRKEIGADSIKFFTSAQGGGESYYASPSGLERKRLLVYSSDKLEDIFLVNFLVDKEIENQTAGTYRTEVRYIVEAEELQKIVPVDLEIEVNSIFRLEIALPPEGMHFANLLPNSPPQERAVSIEVKTNLGRPYIVSQNLSSPLVNQQGKQIPLKFFTIKEKVMEGKTGEAESSAFEPVRLGEAPLFFSDSKGSPSEFLVIYRLTPYAEILAGDYSTQVSYSLGEK